MSNSFWNSLLSWLSRSKPPKDEADLQTEVKKERSRLAIRQARADRILREFHRADVVIRGGTGGLGRGR